MQSLVLLMRELCTTNHCYSFGKEKANRLYNVYSSQHRMVHEVFGMPILGATE